MTPGSQRNRQFLSEWSLFSGFSISKYTSRRRRRVYEAGANKLDIVYYAKFATASTIVDKITFNLPNNVI